MNAITLNPNSLQAQNTADLFNRWTGFIEGTEATVNTYTKAVRVFVSWLTENGITEPTKEDIRAYRDSIKESHKPGTTQLYLIALKQFFNWTEEEGLYPNIAKNVKTGVKLDREHKKDYLTEKQVQKLIGSIDTSTAQGRRDKAIICLMITTGMRTIEVERANVEDLRAVADFTALFYQGKGHSEKAEYKKVAEEVEELIRATFEDRGNITGSEPLFVSLANKNKGERMTTKSLSRIVKTHLREVGLNSDRLTAHSMRHTAATLNLLNGGSLEETQQLLGHMNIGTTMIYAHNLERAKNNSESRISKAIFC